MGARFIPCMKPNTGYDSANFLFLCPAGIKGSFYNGSACNLEDVCSTFGPVNTGTINQWYRFLMPIILHAGILHIAFNMAFQLQSGFQLERDIGSARMAVIYLGSGAGGFIFGAGFSDVSTPSVGASGCLYGNILFVCSIITSTSYNIYRNFRSYQAWWLVFCWI